MGDSNTTTTTVAAAAGGGSRTVGGTRINNSQVTPSPWQEVERTAEHKSIKDWSIQKRNALRARYTYGIIFLLQNLIAWFVRDYGQNFSPQLQYIKSCGSKGRDCLHTVGVLRVSLGCCMFFFVMALTTCNYTSKLNEARSTWHSGWWSLKCVLIILSIAITFFLPLQIIQLYGELARIGAGIFLILQLISVIEFITWWNNYWMPDEEMKKQSSSSNCFLGLFMSTLFYVASVCGIGMMYSLYVPKSSSCTLNIFYITWTAILLGVMMLVSLHSKVNRGLLSSGIMASYIVFLCWSAIRSEPAGKKCSPQKEQNNQHGDWTNVLGFLIAISAIVMATFSTGIDSQTFQFRKDEGEEEEEEEDDIPYEYGYGFFHLVFSLGTMYFAMLFISWNLESSTNKKWSIDVGWASTWVKIVNEWLAATIYLWKLIYPAVLKQTRVENNNNQGGVMMIP